MKKFFIFISALGLTSSLVLTNVRFSEIKPFVANEKFKQIYILGDSLSDTGALLGAGNQILQSIDDSKELVFEPPFYNNRSFSNGKPAAEVLADKLNLPLTPGWKFNFDIIGQDFEQVGNSYAAGGAQATETNDIAGVLLNNFSISKQVDALLEQHTIEDDDLTFFEIGSNDLMFQYLNPLTDSYAVNNPDDVIKNTVANQNKALEKLIDHGNKHILVMNTPDLGLTPSFNDNDKKEIASKVTADYNKAWFNMITNLQAKYPNYIKVFDLYTVLPELLNEFAEKGGITDVGAVHYDLNIDSILADGKITPIYNEGVTEATIDDHFFFDFIHPTKGIHARFGEMLYQTAISQW